jgi:hypothetical protein
LGGAEIGSFKNRNRTHYKETCETKNIVDYMKKPKKQHLPEKICMVCQRPFAWRKKWEKVWEEVNVVINAE